MLPGHVRALGMILGLSAAVRAWLVIGGGQYYWPDERLYRISQTAAGLLLAGDLNGGARTVQRADHPLFQIIGIIPAVVEHVIGANSRIPGLFFSMFSVLSIALVWRVARQLALDDRIALLSAGLLACSTTWLYNSRHLLPYDVAMTFGLLALSAAVAEPSTTRTSLRCGLYASLCLLAYAGYWTLAAVTMLLGATWRAHRLRDVLARGLAVGVAFAVPLAVIFGLSLARGGRLAADYVSFAGTVTQGEFGEGWSLPFAYLWHAEHGLAVAWAVALLAAIRNRPWVPAVRLSVLAVAGIYAALVTTSAVLHVFVVYGRLVRQLVPFLSLLLAVQLGQLMAERRRRGVFVPLVVAAMVIQVAWNWRTPLAQVFPEEFKAAARREAEQALPRRTAILFADHIYPSPTPVATDLDTVMLSEPHPLSFRPYQYEGFTPEQRHLLRTTDIRMRLVGESP